MLKKVPILNNLFNFICNFLNKKIKNKNNNHVHLRKKYKIEEISYYSFYKPFLILKYDENSIISKKIIKDFMKFYKTERKTHSSP